MIYTNMSHEEFWKAALGSIELSISKANFNTWFKDTTILDVENNHVTIGVPNGFAKEWLENKYAASILEALRVIDQKISGISCSIYNPLTYTPSPEESPAPTKKKIEDIEISSTKPLVQDIPSNTTDPFVLNPRYTFDNFIVGENNELAKAACHAVCENLGKIYNPLFIYGGVGLGKTHLLQSIGNYVKDKDAQRRIIYTSSERFTNELVAAIKSNTADRFKDKYQKVDILIIDDVQFLSGKEKTQQEFFHIFNSLYQLNKQIVISSDRPPSAISTLEERLKSRFAGGMIVDIGKPDLETRTAILRTKAAEKHLDVSEDLLHFIAENIKNNVRELEGALNRVFAYTQLHKKPLTAELAQGVLSELIASTRKKGIQNKDIVEIVSDFYEINGEDLISKGRRKEIVNPRQIAMYLLRTELNLSYPGIGTYFGGRDHTTALHAYEKICKALEGDNSKLREEIDYIREKIYSN